MFQTLYDDLPPMPTEVLALRKKFWEAEGQHLIFNVPLRGEGITKKAPLKPFAGLCVSFLLLLRKDHELFCPQIGDRPKAYQVGWNPHKDYGLFSIASTSTSWVGYMESGHAGFPAGYYYVSFYFVRSDTLHGYINNIHLKSDNANPYEVNQASSNILFGQENWHKVETLEVHWVAWSSAHNSNTSTSALDQLFVQDHLGEYHYQFYDIFHVRSGSVITVVTKYKENTSPDKRKTGFYNAVHFGLGRLGDAHYGELTFNECNDTSAIYTFRLNIMENSGLAFWKSTMLQSRLFEKGSSTGGVYFVMNNVKPIRVYVETMGYTW
ncbi:uncharacterized protein [Dermacentor andersoni]|uniref:uncharacterized protein isoform X2 n=1 Tax=Dermacentor andersoni TaxID=34620 RepID=UPI003B3B749A